MSSSNTHIPQILTRRSIQGPRYGINKKKLDKDVSVLEKLKDLLRIVDSNKVGTMSARTRD